MTREEERPERDEPGTNESGESASTRRLLRGLTAGLSVAAVVLAGLLVFLLRTPDPSKAVEGEDYGALEVIGILGQSANEQEQLRQPLGVAFDAQGNVWVSDTGKARIAVFAPSGELLRTVGDTGEGRLVSPYGMTVDGDRVYVADWNAGEVKVFAMETGRFLESLPAPEQDPVIFGDEGFTPYDVQIVDGRVVASSNDGLYFFGRNGLVVERWGDAIRAAHPGAFNFPNAFAHDPESGRFYVADTLNRRVTAFDRAGGVQWVSGTPDREGEITGFWQLPRGVAVGPDGRIFVVDTFRFDSEGKGIGHVVVLEADGTLVSEFGRSGLLGQGLNFPEKVAINGRVLAVVDRENHSIVLFRLGELPEAKPTELEKYAASFRQIEDVNVAREVEPATVEPATAEPSPQSSEP